MAVGHTRLGLKPGHRPLTANYWLRSGNTACVNGAAPTVWRRHHGRADLENRIKELGGQFGLKRLCVDRCWGPEALPHLAIAAYNLGVRPQRRLGQLEKCALNTLRWRLFGRAAVGRRAGGKPTLKPAGRGAANRN